MCEDVGKAMQQQHNRRIRRTGVAVENVQTGDLRGSVMGDGDGVCGSRPLFDPGSCHREIL
jgi:hypothetical protein